VAAWLGLVEGGGCLLRHVRMFGSSRVAVVVPAYDEAALIARTLSQIPAEVDHIVVVDDGSRDRTAAIVEALEDHRLELCRHPRNRGVGAAIRTGYRVAFEAGADVAVVMGGDGQMDPRDLRRLVSPVLEGRADYVKGDRLSWPDARLRMPTERWIGNHVLSLMTRLATGLDVSDSQCGYTAAGPEAAALLVGQGMWSGYGYPNDALGRLAHSALRVVDIPVRPLYGDEISGIGMRHALVVIPWVLARVALRRLVSAETAARGADAAPSPRCASAS